METALSTIVFGYATKGTVDGLCEQDIELSPGEVARSWLLFPPVLLCIGCTIFTGVSHLVCSVRSQGAVNSTASANACEMKRLGRGKWANYLGDDGVDLHEYHDVITVASHTSKVVSLWILFVFSALLLSFGVVLFLLLSYGFPLGPTLWSTIAAYLLVSFVVFFLRGVTGRIWKSAGACRTQPFHPHTRALLLVSTMIYAVLLYLSPAPSTLRWSVSVTHSTRALKVLASLRGQDEGGVDRAGGEDAGDML